MTENITLEDNSATEALLETKLQESSFDTDFITSSHRSPKNTIGEEFEDGEITNDSTNEDLVETCQKEASGASNRKESKKRKRRRRKYSSEDHYKSSRSESSSSSMKISQEDKDFVEDIPEIFSDENFLDLSTNNGWNGVASNLQQEKLIPSDITHSNSNFHGNTDLKPEPRKHSKSSRRNRNRKRNKRKQFSLNQQTNSQTMLPLDHVNTFTQDNSTQQFPISGNSNGMKKFSLLGDPPICNGQSFNFLPNHNNSGFVNQSYFPMPPQLPMNFGLNAMPYPNDFHQRRFPNFINQMNDNIFNNKGCDLHFRSNESMGITQTPTSLGCQDNMPIINIPERRRPSGFSHQPPPVRFATPQPMFCEPPINNKNAHPMLRHPTPLLNTPPVAIKTPLLPEPVTVYQNQACSHQIGQPHNTNGENLVNHTLKEQAYVNDQLDKIARIVMSAKEKDLLNDLNQDTDLKQTDYQIDSQESDIKINSSIEEKLSNSAVKKPVVISMIGKKRCDLSKCINGTYDPHLCKTESEENDRNEIEATNELSDMAINSDDKLKTSAEMNGLKMLQEMFNLPSIHETNVSSPPDRKRNSGSVPITPQSPDIPIPMKDIQTITLVPDYAKIFSRLALRDIPLKIPYPLMQLPADILMNQHDPRLKGRFTMNTTSRLSVDPVIKSSFSISKQNSISNIQLDNFNNNDKPTNEYVTPVGSWQPMKSVHKTRLNEMANGNFSTDKECYTSSTNNRSYLYDPRFRRRKVNATSDQNNLENTNSPSSLICDTKPIVKLESV